MGNVENYGKHEEEKVEILRKHGGLIKEPHDRGYLQVLHNRSFASLSAAEIYRLVQIYDNNHVVLGAAGDEEHPIVPLEPDAPTDPDATTDQGGVLEQVQSSGDEETPAPKGKKSKA